MITLADFADGRNVTAGEQPCTVTFSGGAPGPGDVLLAVYFDDANPGLPTMLQAGWSLVTETSGVFAPGMYVAMKVCGAGESATQTPFYTHNLISGQASLWAIWRLAGAMLDTVLSVLAPSYGNHDVSISFTPTNSTGFAVAAFHGELSDNAPNPAIFSTPSGWAVDGSASGNTNCYQHMTSPPAASPQTVVWTQGAHPGAGAGVLLVLDGLAVLTGSTILGGSARIKGKASTIIGGSATLIKPGSKTIGASARVASQPLHPLHGSARVAGGVPYAIPGSARIARVASFGLGGSATIGHQPFTTLGASARVSLPAASVELDASARIGAIGNILLTGSASVTANLLVLSLGASARILNSNTGVILGGSARISRALSTPWVDRPYKATVVQRVTYGRKLLRGPSDDLGRGVR